MMDLSFVQLATDPNLIPGIYNGCDQWCNYCPATSRCLAFKCQPVNGDAQAGWDAEVSAKVALIGIDRSDEAQQVMALDAGDPRIAHMRKHLSRLRREVSARFPAAPALVRPGLDDAEPRVKEAASRRRWRSGGNRGRD